MNCAKIGRLPRKNHTKQLKAEAPASGATLQRLSGAAAAKNQNGFHICVLRRYFPSNDLLHHRDKENATEASQRAKNGIFGTGNTCDYFSHSINRKYQLYYRKNLLINLLLIDFVLFIIDTLI